MAPSVIATGSLNETQIKNIKKYGRLMALNLTLALFYGSADWWKEFPELDTKFINELAWVGYARGKN